MIWDDSVVHPWHNQPKPTGIPLLYQITPDQGFRYGKYPDKRPTTIEGHCFNAYKRSYCLQANEALRSKPYQYDFAFNPLIDLDVKGIKDLYNCLNRLMRDTKTIWAMNRHINADLNRCHYHGIIAETPLSIEELKAKIANINLPGIGRIKWKNQIRDIRGIRKNGKRGTVKGQANYMTIARIRGVRKKDGVPTDDVYEAKRILFHRTIKLDRHGQSQSFFVKPIEEIWAGRWANQPKVKTMREKVKEAMFKVPETEIQALASITDFHEDFIRQELARQQVSEA